MNIAVITGASSGLGKCYVDAVLKLNKYDEIWLIARRRERLEEIAEQNSNAKFRILPLDLTRDEHLQVYKSELEQKGATIGLLINNAGYGKLGDFDKMEANHCKGMIELNCVALTNVLNLSLPFMKRGSAAINVCSIAAFTPNPRMAVYSSTKAYVYSLSKALRFELKKRGINVLAVCPGPMETEFLALADIAPGSSKTFDSLPRVNPVKAAEKSVKAALKGRGIYTPKGFYKFYRTLSKLIPHGILMNFSKT